MDVPAYLFVVVASDLKYVLLKPAQYVANLLRKTTTTPPLQKKKTLEMGHMSLNPHCKETGLVTGRSVEWSGVLWGQGIRSLGSVSMHLQGRGSSRPHVVPFIFTFGATA